MNNIELYDAVEAEDIKSLANTVNHKIQQGWQPFGPVVTYAYNERPWLVQPLVKYTPDE